MSNGIVGFGQPGAATQPSPNIWQGCPNQLLIDKALGHFAHEDFQANYAISTPTDSAPVGNGSFSYKGDTDTSINSVADTPSGIVDIETDTTAADAGALVTNAFGKIVRNSGNKLWFEARVAPGDVDADMGTFIGVVEEDQADEDVIADDPATNASTADVTLIGYFQNNADPDAYNLLVKNDTDTAEEVKSDVTNATGIPEGNRTSLVDGVGATGVGFHKLGFVFDGRETIRFYVDGYKVAEKEVDSTVDQSNRLAAIVAVKTGDAAAEKLFVDWVRYAYQERS